MPTWAKILIAVIGVGLLVLVLGGFVVFKFVEGKFHDLEDAAQRAEAEGKGYGMTGSLDVCVEEGVRRMRDCEGIRMACIPVVDAFLWGCLEAAPYEKSFCRSVPAAGNDQATMKWSTRTCAQYGNPDDEMCAFALSIVPAFCTSTT